MQVVNLHEYRLNAQALRELNLSLDRWGPDETSRALQQAAEDGLATHSSVARVVDADEAPSDFSADYVVTLSPTARFDGSGLNYLITFPGFLLFTHAWYGFAYEADVTTEIAVRRPGDAAPLASRMVATDWHFRFCDRDRGVLSSSGWYTPGYGGLNLIYGFFMIQYDPDATNPLLRAIHDAYGDFIANQVIDLVGSVDPPPAPAPPQ